MTDLPASGFPSSTDRDVGEIKQFFEDLRSVIAELIGGSAETELTIAAGSVTPTRALHRLDTEEDAAADDLTHLDLANQPDGRAVLLRAEDAARVVTVKHLAGGDGQIALKRGADVTLATNEWLWLLRDGLVWRQAVDIVELATAAQFRSNTGGRVLTTDQVWAAAGLVTLTDAGTIAVDMSAGINFQVTLAGNRTLGNPTNVKAGQSGLIIVNQDATGSRLLAYGANWEFPSGIAPTLTAAANAKDILSFFAQSGSSIIVTGVLKDVS